jgi:hypothetical protein
MDIHAETIKASQIHYFHVSVYTLYPFTTYYQADYDDLIYQVEHDIYNKADTTRPTSFLDIHLEVDSEGGLERNFPTKEMISIL